MEIVLETVIFRMFGALNARRLLYLQSEICTLERHLKELERSDSLSDSGLKTQYATDAWILLEASEERDGDTRQRELMDKINFGLDEYNQALIQQAKIFEMKSPEEYDLNDGSVYLIGDDARVWGSLGEPEGHADDLVALRPCQEVDSYSRWLADNAITYLDKLKILKHRITFWPPSILASLIPITSIAVLKCITSKSARIGAIGAFNFFISVCLTIFADARRADVVAISAA
ncbi:hypothetical protein CC80DRAFT_519864 [Byssothecium circinans]|uniref:DUF6594 domain-containing protein n=1 Tax=Byssothecium circinans TaxID=147558 RepID=A0A6A5TE51_9PLEO|nr:hypothetical protein CC80DRAFT_519864 [Byssothecium circinans]